MYENYLNCEFDQLENCTADVQRYYCCVRFFAANVDRKLRIVFDNADDVMYWGDAGLHRVETAKLDGSSRTIILTSTTAYYFGMAIDSEYLYYTDWTHQ